jgi:hypothetical protein
VVIYGADLVAFMVKTQRFTTSVVQKSAPGKNTGPVVQRSSE